MKNKLSNFVWIKEPSKEDCSFATRGEKTLTWIKRSTNKRAKDLRIFLNRNLDKIPTQYREDFIRKITENWHNGLFELIIARYLQELGAELLYEEPIKGGSRPDFTAIFPDGTIIVEAINPIYNSDVAELEKKRIPLFGYIDKNIPQGWIVFVHKIPDIGLNESKKEFKRKIDLIFNQLQKAKYEWKNEKEGITLSDHISSGQIELELFKTDKKYTRIAIEPPIGFWDDSKKRIKHALDKKRNQIKKSRFPVILAINASGLSSELDDFNQVLYGHSVEVVNERTLDVLKTYFKEDGLFTKKRNIDPTYAGVLACFHFGFTEEHLPILYHNPNNQKHLPKELLVLEQRNYDYTAKSIVSINLKKSDLANNLFFPPL